MNGSYACCVFTPVAGMVMQEDRPGNDRASDQTVQNERAGEVDAEPVAAEVVFRAKLEFCRYGTVLTVSAAA
ncbi:MAG TPA: hypothetical protein VHS13_01285 [Edaphobacter sp.]|nr:hypothetical protein [Edaphobacter sp.]